MKAGQQLRTFDTILKAYDGKLPLNRFLLNYFKQNRQMGSSDRRWASRYLYSFFRMGKTLSNVEAHVKLAIGDFLCNTTSSPVQEALIPELTEKVNEALAEKISAVQKVYPGFKPGDIFPFTQHLSPDIEEDLFLQSFLTQPDLFIRASGDDLEKTRELLTSEGVEIKKFGEQALALPNATKLDQVLPANLNYRVQDLSSQRTQGFFMPAKWDYWWDCCAASGGKSLLLHEAEPSVQLLVSDVRETILHNLDERFQKAGIKKYQKKVIDLLQNNDQILHHYEFDGIILDAPCTGSGTWGRTPEMLVFFDAHRIGFFSKLQRSIAAGVVKYLKPGKPLVYITCSVFKEENEDTVAYLTEKLGLQLERMELIKGYSEKADTMFVARLIKS